MRRRLPDLTIHIFAILVLTLLPATSLGEEDEEDKLQSELDEEIEMHKDADYLDLVEVDEESEFMDEILFLQEEDIVLTAAKHKQKKGFSPSAVIVITRKDIDESGAVTMMELLRRYPAVHIYMFNPLYPTAMIRGTMHVLLIIDGREINTEFFPAPFYSTIPVGIHDIERIEIVLGPNSALYGANAVAAVINIVTRPADLDFSTDLSITAGAHGTSILEGMAGGGLGPVAVRGSFGIDRANSWMDRSEQPRDLMRGNLTLALDLPDGRLSANAGLVNGGGRFYGVMGYMDLHDFTFAHAKVDLALGDLKARAYWYGIRINFDMEIDLYYPAFDVELGTTPTFDLAGDTFQAEGQYDLELIESNLLIAGADFRFTNHRCDQIVNSNVLEYRFGVFLHDEQRFGERLLLTVGARFDWNSMTKPAVSPRAALVFNPAGDHFLRISGGTAFRKPSIMETSTNFKINAEPAFKEDMKKLFEDIGISNPNLDNEILNSVEIGYSGTMLDKSLRLGADVYLGFNREWISFESDIRFDEFMRIDIDKSKIGYDNLGEDSNIIGFNFFIEGEPLKELTLFLRGEWRYEWENETGSEVDKTPNISGSAGFVLRLPAGITANLAVCHVGARRDDVRDPQSSLTPFLWRSLDPITYLLGAVTYRMNLGPSRLDLGLTLFNPTGGRFREKTGVRDYDGSNYGGELIGTRAMLTARFRY